MFILKVGVGNTSLTGIIICPVISLDCFALCYSEYRNISVVLLVFVVFDVSVCRHETFLSSILYKDRILKKNEPQILICHDLTDQRWTKPARNRKLVVDIFTINRVRVLIQFKCYTELYSRKQVQLTILSFSSLILHSGAVWVYTCSAAFFLLIVTVCFPQSATGFI